ncbi:MAG: hypothetical protein VYE81_06190 [Planctomycetota bacterium]|nr:hypothetical protein [Planctomycetota bacterium]
MSLLAVARWMALYTLRRPAAWVGLALCLAAWQLALVLSPLSAGGEGSGPDGLIYEVSFLAGLFGSSLSLGALGQCEWFFLRLAAPQRLAARAVGLLAGGALAVALTLAVPLSTSLLGGGPPLAWNALALGLGLVGVLAHLAAAGLLLLHLPVPVPLRMLALPLATWALPALIGSDGFWPARAARLLDASRHLDLAAAGGSGWSDTWLGVLALATCAGLLAARPHAATSIPAATTDHP